MLKISLHAYSSTEQRELQLRMAKLVAGCDGWVIEESALSPAACLVRFEIGLAEIANLYGALQQAGLHLVPLAHRALTEMCLCRKHLSNNGESRIVSVDLRIGSMDEDHVRFRHLVRVHPA